MILLTTRISRNMARFLVSFGLLSLVNNIALALMVTPDSPCMSLCSDGQGSDSIHGSEIVCQNEHFMTTTAGQKLKSCLSCLQLSTANGNGQNDQHCFIYNMRYTLASCLYGFSNVTDEVATPCSTSRACGPFQLALENGNFITSNETAYGYCSANYNSILSSGTSACLSCLQSGDTEFYLSNFLIALQAGCHQQPPGGTIIGLNASLQHTTAPSSSTSKGISKNTIIGISVSLTILLLITVFIIYILWRKSTILKQRRARPSSLDERYGALNITAPNEGAFGNPQTRFKTISLAAQPPARNINKTSTTQPFNLLRYASDDESMHKHNTVILPAHQAYYPLSQHHSSPHSNADGTVPIMLNYESPSPYQYPPSSHEQTPNSNSSKTFSPSSHHPTRMSEKSETAGSCNQQNTHADSPARDIDRDKDRDNDRDLNVTRDVTTSYARAAIGGTQHSGISDSSPTIHNVQAPPDNGTVEITKSPRVGHGEERGSGGEKKKKSKGTKRMSVNNDQEQDQDQWPGEF
ncbi:hypothetical protein DID88_000778 [Monilinia fructigena]|uniref:LPXTG-domain-containing protein n=1 Tax=Monilinia fructigena TaxID=38457 RepID=A0A395ILA5_9HELO|nr:hypothetical protein DID88_000778 [Monilinia fructigena]